MYDGAEAAIGGGSAITGNTAGEVRLHADGSTLVQIASRRTRVDTHSPCLFKLVTLSS